eukprot:scaffold59969_cov31-Tisochrysis_lutea.AAC.1
MPSTPPVYISFPLIEAATAVTGKGCRMIKGRERERVSQTRAVQSSEPVMSSGAPTEGQHELT